MTQVLQINASIHGEEAQSTQLADAFIAGLPGVRVTRRSLATQPIPHLDAARFAAFTTPADQRSLAQQGVVAESDALIAEIRGADVLVLGLPMYNFGIPSQLKAWFDHIARAGVTFKYTETGPVGLLAGRKAYVFATRGGIYAGSPLDTQTTYLRDFLRFLGITQVEFVYAEGMAMGESARKSAVEKARAAIPALTSGLLAPVALAA
jgi:FMN-dependent NADH-azoreductase